MEVAVFSAAVRSSSVMDDDVFSAAVLEKAPPGRRRVAVAPLHDGRPLARRSLAAKARAVLPAHLKFSILAHLISNALLEHGGSGNQAFERAREREILPVSITSAYDKLGNLPLAVSETLLEEGTQRMNAVLPEPGRGPAAGLLGGSRSLRRRRQGDQACQAAAQAVARPAGGHPRRAGVGGLEPADGPGGGHGRPSRRRSR